MSTPESAAVPTPLHIIAEAGSNHNGDEELARSLVRVAAEAGADSVKFQFINPEGLYLPFYRRGEETISNPVFQQRQREFMAPEVWSDVFSLAQKFGITCSASVFDTTGLNQLVALGAPYVKVASTDLNNPLLLGSVADSGLSAIVSTGMSTLSEIEDAVKVFQQANALGRLTLLHCVSAYPCPLEDARLYMVPLLQRTFGLPIGFSDHTLGTEAALIAVGLGATIVEKHYTTDKSLPGFDHQHAQDPQELSSFIGTLRAAHAACTPTQEKLTATEKITQVRARRGLYAARDLNPGDILAESDVLVVRPRAALGPSDFQTIVGQRIVRAVRQYEPFSLAPDLGPAEVSWEEADRFWRKEMLEKELVVGHKE